MDFQQLSVLLSIILSVYHVGFTKGADDFACNSPGKFQSSVDPMKYHECLPIGDNRFTMFTQTCPKSSCFDVNKAACDFDACYRPEDESMMMMKPIPNFTCPAKGKFPHLDPSRKDGFYKCIDINGNFLVYEYQCLPFKPCFDFKTQGCLKC